MFQLTHPLPSSFYIACSGGVDSMSVLHFLSRSNKKRILGIIYVNHKTKKANKYQNFVQKYCQQNNLPFISHEINSIPPEKVSKEMWWRNERYRIFKSIPGNEPIILAHNLNDCVEEYLMCSLVRGYCSTIPYAHDRCIRPFRLWKKEDILKYAKKHNVKWIEDPTNKDINFKRNFIRHKMMPNVLKINPGIYKIVERLIKNEGNNCGFKNNC